MSWNPDIYLTFASERTRPAAELLARVPVAPSKVIDLGCGPGNSTALLAAQWPDARIEGRESSAEMLAKARASGVRATWIQDDVAAWSPAAPYDVIFSNAVLHWIADHRTLVPRLMRGVASGGALAFQVPRNLDAPLHALLREIAAQGRWAAKLRQAGRFNVLDPQSYFDILQPLSRSVDIWETRYLHVLDGDDPVLAWVSGTALRPFVQPLDAAEREAFIAAYQQRLREAYPRRPDGKTLLPFNRLFVVARAN